jgi:hypothetical protein
METKLRQGGGNRCGGCFVKLNPNPLADNLAQFPKARGLVIEQVQKFRCGKSPVLKSEPKSIRCSCSELLVFETDDGRTFAGADASIFRCVVFIAFF